MKDIIKKARKMDICQECKARLLYPNEYHPYTYCLMAKISPVNWRGHIKSIIINGSRFETKI